PGGSGGVGSSASDGPGGSGGVGLALVPCRSSVRRASALNTLEQRPQRTWPWATRRAAAVTTRVRAHLGQIVNMRTGASGPSATPAREARPTIAVAEPGDMKARRVSGCHVRGLRVHETGEHHLAAAANQGCEGGGELAQRLRED